MRQKPGMNCKTIDQITEQYWDGWQQADLAQAYNKSQGHISRVVNGKTTPLDTYTMKSYKEMVKNIVASPNHRSFEARLRQRETHSKINMQTAERIRRLYYSGNHTQWDLARQFDLNQCSISHIVRGYTWKQIPRE